MIMRNFALAVSLTLASGFALAQQAAAPPPEKLFSSAADVQALIAKAKAERKENAPLVTQRILTLAPYNANLEYRAAVGPAAVHESEAEMFYVIDGSATLVTGGKLADEKRTNAENLSGTGITGGSARPVAKGDFVIVPQGVPHWFSPINGTIILMSVHVPRK
jgi:mannose-6-phosphate isomerase-like protein (cupin superfamily)